MADRAQLDRPKQPFKGLLGSTARLPQRPPGYRAPEYSDTGEHGGKKDRLHTLGRSSERIEFSRLLAPAVYLFLFTVHDIIAGKSANTIGERLFEPACLVLCVEIGKLLASLVFLVTIRPAMPTMAECQGSATVLTIPAVCYTAVNMINFGLFTKVNFYQHEPWYQFVFFFNFVLWCLMFRRPLAVRQAAAIVTLLVGCCINTMPLGFKFSFDPSVLLVIATALFSSVGSVCNEYFYKLDWSMDINVQNVILYCQTSLCSLCLVAMYHLDRFESLGSFFHGFDGECFALLIVQVFLGLTVSRILKYNSVMTKSYVMAFHMPLQAMLYHRVLGKQMSAMSLVSTLLLGLSACLFYAVPSAINASWSAKETEALMSKKHSFSPRSP